MTSMDHRCGHQLRVENSKAAVFAVKLSKVCERCVKRMADRVGEGVHAARQWSSEGLQEMAAHFFNMAAQAARMQYFRHSVLLWRTAGYLWSQVPRISVDHLRLSHEAYLLASEDTLRIANTVSISIELNWNGSVQTSTAASMEKNMTSQLQQRSLNVT